MPKYIVEATWEITQTHSMICEVVADSPMEARLFLKDHIEIADSPSVTMIEGDSLNDGYDMRNLQVEMGDQSMLSPEDMPEDVFNSYVAH